MRRIRAGLLVSAAAGIAVSLSSLPFADTPFARANASQRLDKVQGLAAWNQVYAVLISPRCINCHTATNYPQQGDERRKNLLLTAAPAPVSSRVRVPR